MLATLIFACGSLFLKPQALFDPVAEDFRAIPKTIGFWVGADVGASPSARMLPNSSVLVRSYRDLAGGQFVLTIVCGMDLSDLHKPEYCLEANDWQTDSSRTVEVITQSGESHRAKLLRIRAPDSRRLACLYWFAGADGGTDVLASRKWDVVRRVLVSGRLEPTALVRLTAPIGDNPAATEEELILVAGALDRYLENMLGPLSVPQ